MPVLIVVVVVLVAVIVILGRINKPYLQNDTGDRKLVDGRLDAPAKQTLAAGTEELR